MKKAPKKLNGKKSLLQTSGPRIDPQFRHNAGPLIKGYMETYNMSRKQAIRAAIKDLQRDTIVKDLFGGPKK